MFTLDAFLRARMPLSDTAWQQIAGRLQPFTARPGELLIHAGQPCDHLFFLETGLVRFFYLRDGQEQTRYFTRAGEWFTSQPGFSLRQPARESVEALTPCSGNTLSWHDLQALYREVEGLDRCIRGYLQEINGWMAEMLDESLHLTADVRYQQLIGEMPEVAKYASLKDIASYLGIAPDSLSRIRRQLAARSIS